MSTISLSDDPAAVRILPKSLEYALLDKRRQRNREAQRRVDELKPGPRQQRMDKAIELIFEMERFFPSGQRLSEANDTREVTLLPWRSGKKCPGDEYFAKLEHTHAFLPRLEAVVGDALVAGIWFTCWHYGFDTGRQSRFGAWTPANILHSLRREDQILAAAFDDFHADSKFHRAAVSAQAHKLLEGGYIKINDPLEYIKEPTREYSPYFHWQPRSGKSLVDKR